MKNKILIFVFMAVGAVMLSTTNGFSRPSFCDDPQGRDCAQCHADESSCITTPPPACNDTDKDGYGNPGNSSCANSGTDCNDSDASINPGAVEICTDGIDNDCDGYIDQADSNPYNCPADCTDFDEDGFSIEGVAAGCGPEDCDDSDASINPDITEVCTDGFDNDCDGNIDSADSNCPADSCADYGTDRNRCKADPRCSWSGKNKECTEPVVSAAQSQCDATGGRWNKKKGTCR